VVLRKKPILAIEAKFSLTETSKSLTYFKNKFPETRAVQVHFEGKKEFITSSGIEHLTALSLLSEFV